jgi:hypothetical protein
MATPISPNEMQKWIEQEIAEQPHIGFRKALMDMVLEARSPFDPQARRKPKAAIVLGAVLFVAAGICFCYFNFGS